LTPNFKGREAAPVRAIAQGHAYAGTHVLIVCAQRDETKATHRPSEAICLIIAIALSAMAIMAIGLL
jgi:cytochrome b